MKCVKITELLKFGIITQLPIHIAQNIAERCQEYFLYFIAIEILSQHFCQILQNISSQHYNFNFLKYF